jgi:hypothetical protein
MRQRGAGAGRLLPRQQGLRLGALPRVCVRQRAREGLHRKDCEYDARRQQRAIADGQTVRSHNHMMMRGGERGVDRNGREDCVPGSVRYARRCAWIHTHALVHPCRTSGHGMQRDNDQGVTPRGPRSLEGRITWFAVVALVVVLGPAFRSFQCTVEISHQVRVCVKRRCRRVDAQ